MSEILENLALHEQGYSINEIAKLRRRSKSTIQRCLNQLKQANIGIE